MTKKAFLIGANTLGLKYAEDDVKLMKEALIKYEYEIVSPPVDKYAILSQFDDLISNVEKIDTVIFYFSGHGHTPKGDLLLVVKDELQKEKSSISIRHFIEPLENCRAENKLMVLDCCKADAAAREWNPEQSARYRILTASERLERGKEIDQFRASFLTYYLHRALISDFNDVVNEKGILYVNELYNWLKLQTQKHNAGEHTPQVPIPNLLGNQKANFAVGAVEMTQEKPIFQSPNKSTSPFMTDNIWQEIEKELNQLQENTSLRPFRPLILKVKRLISARIYSHEIIHTFVELISQMGAEVRQGKSIPMILEEASSYSGSYSHPLWDIDNVYQANRYIFQTVLNRIRAELEPEFPDLGRMPIPIVLLVMCEAEAQELSSGAAFQRYPKELTEDFHRFKDFISSHGISNWEQNYEQYPYHWKPFKDNEQNIEFLIEQTFQQAEILKSIYPQFIDIRTLNDEENRKMLQQLRQIGCVVIIDTISMQHPALQQEFRKSMLDVFPTTIVSRITPLAEALNFVQSMAIVIEKRIEMEFDKRFCIDLDANCQEISTLIDFKRWLKNRISQLLPDDVQIQTGTRKFWFQ